MAKYRVHRGVPFTLGSDGWENLDIARISLWRRFCHGVGSHLLRRHKAVGAPGNCRWRSLETDLFQPLAEQNWNLHNRKMLLLTAVRLINDSWRLPPTFEEMIGQKGAKTSARSSICGMKWEASRSNIICPSSNRAQKGVGCHSSTNQHLILRMRRIRIRDVLLTREGYIIY